MENNVENNSVKFYGLIKWLAVFVMAIIMFCFSLVLIFQADFFADNIKLFPDDPYIYWVLGWILFVLFALILLPVSCVKFLQCCIQFCKKEKTQSVQNDNVV